VMTKMTMVRVFVRVYVGVCVCRRARLCVSCVCVIMCDCMRPHVCACMWCVRAYVRACVRAQKFERMCGLKRACDRGMLTYIPIHLFMDIRMKNRCMCT